MRVPLELRVDSISSIMLAMVTGVSLLVAPLRVRLHASRPGLSALLRRRIHVRFLDVHAGAVEQLCHAVCLLGNGGALQLPADRILVP
ncbi:MAG UNVERIFIED_CONTAM: hypothetical protein LVR18_51095 [Planctomycetaceae bacterium]